MNLIPVLVTILCLAFVFYQKQKNKDTSYSVAALVLLTVSVSCLIYLGFFHYADYVHSFNLQIDRNVISAWVFGQIQQYDGIEGYVLYSLMFLNIALAFSLAHFILCIKNKMLYWLLFYFFTLVSGYYFFTIGFMPPVKVYESDWVAWGYSNQSVVALIAVVVITTVLWKLNEVNEKIALGIIAVLLLPVCFIATGEIHIQDYSYILAPALRLINGNPLSEIYFQYDLFLSLLAAVWMKLKLDINSFQVLGQFSYYALFIGVFLFAKKFFRNKNLPVFILVSLTVVRYYATMYYSVAEFQTTPIRLDLWLILLFLVYYKGLYHWLNALFLGLLLIVHKNFGIIYLFAYLQLILVLFVAEVFALQKINLQTFTDVFKRHVFLNAKNFGIIAGAFILSIILFGGFIPESALLYQRIGIGMMPIAVNSFYWYVPAFLSLCFILLFYHRKKLSAQYFQTGLLIVLLTIGKSIYFFGRSHEHNLLLISPLLLLLLFLFFDLAEISQGDKKALPLKLTKVRQIIVMLLPALFVVVAAYYYSGKIESKVQQQLATVKSGRLIYLLQHPTDFAAIKRITNNSDKVYFVLWQNDFLYYYYGNYKPVGYFSPCGTWLLKDDLLKFLQKLLDDGYYVIGTNESLVDFSRLQYNKVSTEAGFMAFSK